MFMYPFRSLRIAGLALFVSVCPASAQESQMSQWLRHLEMRTPKSPGEFSLAQRGPLEEATDAVDRWSEELSFFRGAQRPEQLLPRVDEMIVAQQRVDALLDRTLALRTTFAAAPLGDRLRPALRQYLRTTSALIDLAGRMRFQVAEAIEVAAYRIASQPELREKMIEMLLERRSEVGAAVMGIALIDPPADAENAAKPANTAVKAKLLELIGRTNETSQLPILARLLRDKNTPPELIVLAAEAVRRVGLPQDERPGQDKELPKPEITAAELHGLLSKTPADKLSVKVASLREELLGWLAIRKEKGLEGDAYRLGSFEVRPGDWLLMRNPSPYNLFTDLSPGLFTHVGVATIETGADGKRRMVLVDIPERGRSIPATNVDAYVLRSLHYVFVRHPDAAVARKLANVAASIVGNESEFDLNFRTENVLPLRGKPLAGRKIKTYCAGLLLLCAQETARPREAFFPIPERGSGGNMDRNIAGMGFSIGKDFISPTGALFSAELTLVGRRPPVYDPVREIQETIFDHFASSLVDKTYVPSLNFSQSLRLKLAEYAKQDATLADAIRKKENIGSEVDLVAAAKAQAFVETLDEIAFGHSRQFSDALLAITGGNLDDLVKQDYTAAQVAELKKLREKHVALHARLATMTPRQLRIELVRYYVQRGKDEVDRRFYGKQE